MDKQVFNPLPLYYFTLIAKLVYNYQKPDYSKIRVSLIDLKLGMMIPVTVRYVATTLINAIYRDYPLQFRFS